MAKHYSYWFKQALEQEFGSIKAGLESTKPLQKDVNCDIAIVGGGYTGLWTAILIKQQEPQKHVVVIEKDLCGSGASGANGGCMLTWSTKYPTLKKLYGKEQAKWLVKNLKKSFTRSKPSVTNTRLTRIYIAAVLLHVDQ